MIDARVITCKAYAVLSRCLLQDKLCVYVCLKPLINYHYSLDFLSDILNLATLNQKKILLDKKPINFI